MIDLTIFVNLHNRKTSGRDHDRIDLLSRHYQKTKKEWDGTVIDPDTDGDY